MSKPSGYEYIHTVMRIYFFIQKRNQIIRFFTCAKVFCRILLIPPSNPPSPSDPPPFPILLILLIPPHEPSFWSFSSWSPPPDPFHYPPPRDPPPRDPPPRDPPPHDPPTHDPPTHDPPTHDPPTHDPPPHNPPLPILLLLITLLMISNPLILLLITLLMISNPLILLLITLLMISNPPILLPRWFPHFFPPLPIIVYLLYLHFLFFIDPMIMILPLFILKLVVLTYFGTTTFWKWPFRAFCFQQLIKTLLSISFPEKKFIHEWPKEFKLPVMLHTRAVGNVQ